MGNLSLMGEYILLSCLLLGYIWNITLFFFFYLSKKDKSSFSLVQTLISLLLVKHFLFCLWAFLVFCSFNFLDNLFCWSDVVVLLLSIFCKVEYLLLYVWCPSACLVMWWLLSCRCSHHLFVILPVRSELFLCVYVGFLTLDSKQWWYPTLLCITWRMLETVG